MELMTDKKDLLFFLIMESNLIRKETLLDNKTLEIFDDIQIIRDQNNKIVSSYIRTTPGRILINELLAAAIYARPIGLNKHIKDT
jgi:hypothetical protein